MPENDASPHDRAYQKIEAKDFDGAIADLTALLEQKPGDAFAMKLRGWARMSKQDHDGALADFDGTLAAFPGDDQTMFRRAMCLYQLRRYPECKAEYDRFISRNPNDAMARYNRGLTYEMLGDVQSAIGDFERAAVLNPNDTDAPKRRDALKAKPTPVASVPVSKRKLVDHPIIAWPLKIIMGLGALALACGCFYLGYLAIAHSIAVISGKESGKIITPILGGLFLGGIGVFLAMIGVYFIVSPLDESKKEDAVGKQ